MIKGGTNFWRFCSHLCYYFLCIVRGLSITQSMSWELNFSKLWSMLEMFVRFLIYSAIYSEIGNYLLHKLEISNKLPNCKWEQDPIFCLFIYFEKIGCTIVWVGLKAPYLLNDHEMLYHCGIVALTLHSFNKKGTIHMSLHVILSPFFQSFSFVGKAHWSICNVHFRCASNQTLDSGQVSLVCGNWKLFPIISISIKKCVFVRVHVRPFMQTIASPLQWLFKK